MLLSPRAGYCRLNTPLPALSPPESRVRADVACCTAQRFVPASARARTRAEMRRVSSQYTEAGRERRPCEHEDSRATSRVRSQRPTPRARAAFGGSRCEEAGAAANPCARAGRHRVPVLRRGEAVSDARAGRHIHGDSVSEARGWGASTRRSAGRGMRDGLSANEASATRGAGVITPRASYATSDPAISEGKILWGFTCLRCRRHNTALTADPTALFLRVVEAAAATVSDPRVSVLASLRSAATFCGFRRYRSPRPAALVSTTFRAPQHAPYT
ncbi:hypothetical protein DFH09DRAFT_1360903 [Mycena vulgaris]|nr:hypothetical protein DFH09DRAFT_1360903 [Mycena vulgaris]